MADYRFSAQIIARSQGRSVTAAAAYRSGTEIADARTGEVHDYTRKGGVEWTGIAAPEGAPAWARNRELLWNMVEQKEVRKDAQLAREVQLSLPHELTFEQRKALVVEFVQREFVGRGMVADIAMHKPDRGGDQRNFHVHILLTTREIGPEGFGKKNRDWNSREELGAMRAAWAEAQNTHLRQNLGPEAPQVTHLSYAERGVDKVPTIHLGPTVTGMERRGIETYVGDYNRQASRRNQTIRSSRERMAEIDAVVEKRAHRSFGYVANEARLEVRKAIEAKREAEADLRKILAEKAGRFPGGSKNALKAALVKESKAEIRAAKARLTCIGKKGRGLRKRARSLSNWVNNPARMIWLKIAELHQRDRLEEMLRLAEAKLSVRENWLASADGRAWLVQEGRDADMRRLRTDERKARRHVRAAERQVAEAARLARHAEVLNGLVYGRKDLPDGVDLPLTPKNGRQYLSEMAKVMDSATRRLPRNLQQKVLRGLGKGRGIAD